MNIVATIQARMSSSRLPGKVLKEILGKPLLLYQIERIRQSFLIDDIIIATSTSPADDPIVAFAEENDVSYYRGSENDVLQRIVDTLINFHADIHVEFMGDNPIPDVHLVDAVIGFYLKNKDKYDYVTNALKTTYPPGFEVFVYPASVLIEAEKTATETKLREHVGLHIYQKPEKFRIFNIEANENIRKYKDLHFEVDTEEDFEVIKALIEHYAGYNPFFAMNQAIDFLVNNPELMEKNIHVPRRWQQFRND